jgi:sister chromatid cohesion protein PDS5
MDVENEWFEDDEVPAELRAKILALKVCRNRSLAHASSESALEISTPVLKMLTTLLLNNGSFKPDSDDECVYLCHVVFATAKCRISSPRVMSRIRLQAGVSLLHLSTVQAYGKAIAPQFVDLALTVQVSVYRNE